MRNYKLLTDRHQQISDYNQDPLFSAIFEDSPDAIFLLNPVNFKIVDCNVKSLQLFQMQDKSEVIGKESFSLYNSEPVEFSKNTFIETINNGTGYNQELPFRSVQGNVFWGKNTIRKVNHKTGSIIIFRVRRVVDYMKTAETLSSMIRRTSKSCGHEFFTVLTELLCESFGVNMAFVATFDREYNTGNTIHCRYNDHKIPDLTFDLPASASYNLLKGYTTYYPCNLPDMFPHDSIVKQFGMESYLGTPVFDTGEQVCGMLVLMDDKRMEEIPNSRHILSLFASRAAAEMARIDVEQSYRRKIKELQGMIGNT
jgi:PAS domain S-box-containing protein